MERKGRCCSLASLQLTHTCRQLREEYLPICIKVPVIIDWNDVPAYLNVFYSSNAADGMRNLDKSPAAITVFVEAYLDKHDEPVAIDILLIAKMRLANPNFNCDFTLGPDVSDLETAMYSVFDADVGMLQAIVNHHNEVWLNDIEMGKVVKLTVGPISTSELPQITVFILEEIGVVNAGDEQENIHRRDQYVLDVQLAEGWATCTGRPRVTWVKG